MLKLPITVNNDTNSCETSHSIYMRKLRHDSVYLTCSRKPTGSQLSLPHGINKKLKSKTKNKLMSMIGPSEASASSMSNSDDCELPVV